MKRYSNPGLNQVLLLVLNGPLTHWQHAGGSRLAVRNKKSGRGKPPSQQAPPERLRIESWMTNCEPPAATGRPQWQRRVLARGSVVASTREFRPVGIEASVLPKSHSLFCSRVLRFVNRGRYFFFSLYWSISSRISSSSSAVGFDCSKSLATRALLDPSKTCFKTLPRILPSVFSG